MPRTISVRSILALAGSIALMAASPAWSQQLRATPATQQLLQGIPVGMALDRYLESLRNTFFVADADIDGQITQRDIDLHTVMEGIQVRTNAINMVMRYDLDGDGFVTEDEVRRGMSYDRRAQLGLAAFNKLNKPQLPGPDAVAKQIDDMVRTIVALDADHDGKVSMAEAAKFGAPGVNGRGASGQAARARQLLELDGASKGALWLAEYQAMGETLFRQIDADKDGMVSQQELNDYRTRAERAGCEMPAATEKAKVVVLSSYQTEALSNVTLGSQDNVVHAGRVVEPGSEPLYVVIASYSPTIWQFSGAVERLERLILTSSLTGPNSGDPNQRSLAGATGVAAEKLHFFNKSNCLTYFNEVPSSASLQTIATIRSWTAKTPDRVAAKYSVASFTVPSGAIESLRERPKGAALIIEKTQGTLKLIGDPSGVIVQSGPSRAKDDMYRFSPGGVIEIDPKSVIGSVPAASYEVLPQQAGLVQLLASGALKQNSLGEYIVREKIRFPAGLYGAHSVTFLVMKGAPYPDGDPGHSCVIMEENGEKKGTCR